MSLSFLHSLTLSFFQYGVRFAHGLRRTPEKKNPRKKREESVMLPPPHRAIVPIADIRTGLRR